MLARNEYHLNNDPNFILKKLGFFFTYNDSQEKIANRNIWQIPNYVKLLFHPKDLLSDKTTSWNLSILPIKLNSFWEEKEIQHFSQSATKGISPKSCTVTISLSISDILLVCLMS